MKPRKHTGPRKRRPKKRTNRRGLRKECDDNQLDPNDRIGKDIPHEDSHTRLSANALPFVPKDLANQDDFDSMKHRIYWKRWVIAVTEQERLRRIQLLQQIQQEEDNERELRRAWANSVIKAEHEQIIRNRFLDTTANTQWFQQTIAPSHKQDYEVVCPNSWFGCLHTCMLRSLDDHLKKCPHIKGQFDLASSGKKQLTDLASYEVVCPNTLLGCNAIVSRDKVAEHLAICPKAGMSREKELEERLKWRRNAIVATEEERQRRIKIQSASNDLQRLFEKHTQKLQISMHREIQEFVENSINRSIARRSNEMQVIEIINASIIEHWPGAQVELYGSFVTLLNGPESDVDIVIFKAEGNISELADHLRKVPCVHAATAFEHASMPVIKVITEYNDVRVAFDISLDDPVLNNHNGIACAEMILVLIDTIPGLKELTIVLKHFLSVQKMNRPFHGGLSSYGLILMIAHVLLQNGTLGTHDTSTKSLAVRREEDCSRSSFQRSRGRQIARSIIRNHPGDAEAVDSDRALGKQLMDFLHHYGDCFQIDSDYVALIDIEESKKTHNQLPPGTIRIEDPLDSLNNVGRNCFCIRQILDNFAQALENLMALVVREPMPTNVLQHMTEPKGGDTTV